MITSLPPVVNHVQESPARRTINQVAIEWLVTYTVPFGVGEELAACRRETASEADARRLFARRLPRLVLLGLSSQPSDEITEISYGCLISCVDWQFVSEEYADEMTPGAILLISAIEQEAAAVEQSARAAEAGEELADEPLRNYHWSAGSDPFDAPADSRELALSDALR